MSLVVDKEKTAEARRRRPTASKDRMWWTAPPEDVAKRLSSWCNNIVSQNWQRRWDSLTYFRYATGRAVGPASYNFSPTIRPARASLWARGRFEPPRYNVIMQCSDGLGARVYKERPFVQVCPIAGDFKARVKSKKLSRWLDACFFDLKLWPIVEQCGEDARTWGTGFLKIDVDPLTKGVRATRILQDEIIIDESEADSGGPRRLAIMVFANKDEMLETYGTDEKSREAIENAPRAQPGLYFGSDIDYSNVIVLTEAWSLPKGSEIKGRYVLSIGDHALDDKEWTRAGLPLAKLTFKSVSTSWFGMGMPEMVLGLQRDLDRSMAAMWENMRRAAWPRIIHGVGANVNPGTLGDKSNGIVPVADINQLKFEFPPWADQAQFQYIETIVRRIKETFRENDQATQGVPRRELSGVAIEKAEIVDDAAHLPQLQHLEDFVIDIGVLLIEAAEQCKPSVKLPGRTVQEIKWDDVQLSKNSYSMRCFPVGRLSKDMATRQKQIDVWYAQGKISKATAMRLEQVPDVDGFMDLYNASLDFIESALDRMVEEGDYEPPTGLEDLAAAGEIAQSRYLQEKNMKTPQDRLDLILKYIVAVEQLQEEAAPAPAAPGLPVMPGPMLPGGPIDPAMGGAPPPVPGVGIGGVPIPAAPGVPLAA